MLNSKLASPLIISISLCLLVILTYVGFVFFYSLNIPLWDDFDIHLNFLVEFFKSNSWDERFKLLLTRNGEHIVFSNKAFTLLDWCLYQELSFKRLILWGNLALLCSFGLLLLISRKTFLTAPITLVIVCLLIFQLQFPQSSLWASGAIEHFWIFPWALSCFYLANRRGLAANVAAVVACGAAIFTQGNGVLCGISLAFTFFLVRDWKKSLFWATLFSCSLLVHYNQVAQVPSNSTGISIFKYLGYCLTFIGSGMGPTQISSLVAGALLTLLAIYLLNKGAPRLNPALTSFLIWLLLTAMANAIARTQFGVDYAFSQSRYHLVSLMIVCALYLICLEFSHSPIQRRSIHFAAAILALYTYLNGYYQQRDEWSYRYQSLQDSALFWQVAKTGLSYPSPQRPKEILFAASNLKLYQMPAIQPVPVLPIVGNEVSEAPAQPLSCAIEQLLQDKSSLYVSGYVVPKRVKFSSPDSEFFIRLRGKDGDNLTYRAESRLRLDVSKHFNFKKKNHLGFFLVANTTALKAQNYQLEVILKSGQSLVCTRTKAKFSRQVLASDPKN